MNALPGIGHGIGFRLYGERDHNPDGSYVTTRFFCVAYLPIIPIHTLRVIPKYPDAWVNFGPARFRQIANLPLDWNQVFSVYLAALVVVIYGALFFWVVKPYLLSHYGFPTDDLPEFVMFCCWMALAWIAIRNQRARQRRRYLEENRDLNQPISID